MNFAHLHLLMNHIPVIGFPLVMILFVYGVIKRSLQLQKVALVALIAIAAVTVPVHLTGEPAEEVVESLPGISENLIESHEEAALTSTILVLATGFTAAFALWSLRKSGKLGYVSFVVMGFLVLSILALGYTSNLGGQIRHSEIRSSTASGDAALEVKKDDD